MKLGIIYINMPNFRTPIVSSSGRITKITIMKVFPFSVMHPDETTNDMQNVGIFKISNISNFRL